MRRGQAEHRVPRELPSVLTARQLIVLRLLADGHSRQEIADRLFISLETVKSHHAQILARLDAKNRVHAVHLAHQRGLIE